jgi:hypothetical protein
VVRLLVLGDERRDNLGDLFLLAPKKPRHIIEPLPYLVDRVPATIAPQSGTHNRNRGDTIGDRPMMEPRGYVPQRVTAAARASYSESVRLIGPGGSLTKIVEFEFYDGTSVTWASS